MMLLLFYNCLGNGAGIAGHQRPKGSPLTAGRRPHHHCFFSVAKTLMHYDSIKNGSIPFLKHLYTVISREIHNPLILPMQP